MPPKKLTSKDLEALGGERLAELLMELAQEDAATRRRLRYALAQTRGADELVREVRKRLAAMRRARSSVDWQRAKQLAGDLEQQRALIVDKIGPEDPATALEQAETETRGRWPDFEWEDARIDALGALGRHDEAQALRWSCFERSLSARHLRDYLKRLPPVEQLDVEERSMAVAQEHASVLEALQFLVSWPALPEAATLVTRRAVELDGNHYHLLGSAAEALMARYPLAASLALRAMIDDSLEHGRSTRYRHAARHLATCAALAAGTVDWHGFESHEDYLARLRDRHKRKVSFWSLCRLPVDRPGRPT